MLAKYIDKYIIVFSLITALSSTVLQGQSIFSGKIVDSVSNEPLEFVTIKYVTINRNDTITFLSDKKGQFTIKNAYADSMFFLVLSHMGYKVLNLKVERTSDAEVIFRMLRLDNMLKEVVVESPTISIKKDTIEYRADAFTPKQKNSTVEDLLKKLPGVQVTKEGNVIAQGKQVTKIKVNGKDFFGGDPQIATKNLSADVIAKVQVIDDLSEQAKFSGFDDGNREKVINLVLKKDKNEGSFGRISAGAGPGNHYQLNTLVNYFNTNQQISLLANANNVNSLILSNGSNFSGGLSKLIKAQNSVFDNYGGSGSFSNIVTNNDLGFLTNTAGSFRNGINDDKYIGFNYNNKFNSKLSLYGSYLHISNQNYLDRFSIVKNLFPDTSFYYTEEKNYSNRQYQNRVFLNLDYQIDTANSIKLTSTFNNLQNPSDLQRNFIFFNEENIITTRGLQNYKSDIALPDINANLILRHRFKKARTMTLNGTIGQNKLNQTYGNFVEENQYQPNKIDTLNQLSDITNNNKKAGLALLYTNPLNKKLALQVGYVYNAYKDINDKKTYRVDDFGSSFTPSLSNYFRSSYFTQEALISLKKVQKKYTYVLGIGLSPFNLKGSSLLDGSTKLIIYRNLKLIPHLNLNYEFKTNERLSFSYTANIKQPSINQLQPVLDFTDPLYIRIGNPTLLPEYQHIINLNYNKFNLISGKILLSSLTASFFPNKIIDAVAVDSNSNQVLAPVNANGIFNARAFYYFSQPYNNRRYVLSVKGSLIYNKDISFLSMEKNTSKNWIISQDLYFEYYPNQWIESTIGLVYGMNNISYTLQNLPSTYYDFWTINTSLQLFFRNGYNFKYDLLYRFNGDVKSPLEKDVILLNCYAEKEVTKKNIIIRIQVNDVLNKNSNYVHTVTSIYNADINSNILKRFFLISLNWKFQTMKGVK